MNIKELRIKTNLSQSQFAKKFNIPVGTISHWEQGVRKPPIYVEKMIEHIIKLENMICSEKCSNCKNFKE